MPDWIPAALAVDSYDCEWPDCPREATVGALCSTHDKQQKELSMNGATAAQLPRHEKLLAESEWPFEVGLVYLNDLIVDHTYQRPPDEPFIKRIGADFDPTLVGTIDVNARDDGTFATLDGQQRVGGMAIAGKTACYCSIYTGMTIEDEAGFFFRKNKDRKTMLPYYAFRARAVAGDMEANAITAAVEALGFKLDAKTNDTDTIGAVRSVEMAWRYTSAHRNESLTPALRTIRASGVPGSGRKGAFDSTMITGVARFWQIFTDEEVERQVVADIIAEVGPVNFIGLVRERQAGMRGASQSWTSARVLAEHVNKRLRGSDSARLDLKRLTPKKGA